MQDLTALELAAWLDDAGRSKPLLLDVREPWEFQTCHIATAKSMPMQTVPAHYPDLDKDTALVCICHHGARSLQVARFLEQQGFTQVNNLRGGIDAWARQVDPAMPTY